MTSTFCNCIARDYGLRCGSYLMPVPKGTVDKAERFRSRLKLSGVPTGGGKLDNVAFERYSNLMVTIEPLLFYHIDQMV